MVNTLPAPAAKLSALAAAAACDVTASTTVGGAAPASPSSPSRGGGNRVGGENIAALRERMSQIQIAYSQQSRRPQSAAAAAVVASASTLMAKADAEAPASGATAGFSPLVSDELSASAPIGGAAASGGLEAIQRRIRDLSAGGVA